MSDGQRLISGYYDQAMETFELKLSGLGQDDAIARMRTLQSLLKKASDYWTKSNIRTPVWLAVKARDRDQSPLCYYRQGYHRQRR